MTNSKKMWAKIQRKADKLLADIRAGKVSERERLSRWNKLQKELNHYQVLREQEQILREEDTDPADIISGEEAEKLAL